MRHGAFHLLVGISCSLLIALALVGCPASPPTPPAVLSLTVNDGAATTDSRTVTLNNTCQGNPTEYIVSESSTFDGAVWKAYSSHPTFVLSAGHGLKHIYFRVRNVTQVSPLATESVTLTLIVVPVVTSISINKGATTTRWRTVTLNNVCTGDPTDFMASESAAFDGSAWTPYGEMPAFIVSSGDGSKTIHFKVKNIEAESPVVSISTTLAESAAFTPRVLRGYPSNACSIESTADGGNVVAGDVQYVTDDAKFYLGKSDAAGLLDWQSIFGNSKYVGSRESVAQASDGGYVMSGTLLNTDSLIPWCRMTLIKTDDTGALEWLNYFDGFGVYSECNVVRHTADGGFVLAGDTGGDYVVFSPAYLVKTDASGRLEWQVTHEPGISGTTSDLRQTRDGGYILTGWSQLPDDFKPTEFRSFYFLLKTDGLGRQIWEKEFPVKEGIWQTSRVRQTTDGGYVLVSEYGAALDRTTMGVTKTNSFGEQMWRREFQGLGQSGFLFGIVQTNDGGYMAVGTTESLSAPRAQAMYVVRLEANGDMEWQNTFSGLGTASGCDICSMGDGSYVLCGWTGSIGSSEPSDGGPYLVKIDAAGNQVW